MTHKLTLRKANHRRAMMETTDRYDLLKNGVKVAEVYFNTRGYVIDPAIPLPGGSLQMPECGISRIRRELATLNRINREAKQ